jgi:ribosome biogenesis protein YTM1
MDQLAPLSASSTLLLTSHADRTVSLWDARESTSIISLSFPAAHSSQIPVVRAHPTNANSFFTAGHDGAIKVWDVRSPKQALLGVQRQAPAKGNEGKEKLLGGDWDGKLVAVGGESCELEVYQGNL